MRRPIATANCVERANQRPPSRCTESHMGFRCHYQLPYAYLAGITQFDAAQYGCVDPQQSQVRVWIFSNQLGVEVS